MGIFLLYVGGGLSLMWGISHLFPTGAVVKGFGDISLDNKRIITMEWIIEGVALIFIGILTIVVTAIDSEALVSNWVYGMTAAALIALAVVSLFTGFKVNFLPYKLCPVIFTSSAILILLGMLL